MRPAETLNFRAWENRGAALLARRNCMDIDAERSAPLAGAGARSHQKARRLFRAISRARELPVWRLASQPAAIASTVNARGRDLKALKAKAAEQPVVHDQEYNGADSRDDHGIEIESGYAPHSEGVEEPAPDNCSSDAKKNVQYDALSGPIDDFAGNEAGNEPNDDPRDN